MKRAAVFIAYILTPSIPSSIYMRSIGAGFNVYSLSVMLGVTAFIMICNQFILASRPAFAVKALGMKGLLTFHATMPFIILGIAGTHRVLKRSVGFPMDSAQAVIGALAFLIFVAAAVFAILFLANINLPFAARLRQFRKWAQERIGLSYKLSRAFHNVTVAAGVAIAMHVLLASSSDFGANLIGAAWMVAWFILSIALYARYRIRGRNARVGAVS